ncbi:hypothetical protein B296_00009677 [Ensete ventricosum]|uniref:Uncharacterized protein n=1 Tax=Ensete ventricosum TaxID=4639 RepID=A0A427B5N5_ENSVE|nr:hypothetical protein B296_00009677 [Ensete ventricosum]
MRTRYEQAQLQDGGDDEPAGSVSSPAAAEDKQAPPPDPSLLGKADEERRAILRGGVLCDNRRPPHQVVDPRRSRLFRWLLQIEASRSAGAVPPEAGAPRSEARRTCFLPSTSDHQLTAVAAWCRRGSAANEPTVSAAISAAAEPTSNATDSPAAVPSPATVAIVQLSSASFAHTTATASLAPPSDPIPSVPTVPRRPTRLLFKEGLPMNELLSPIKKKSSSKNSAFLRRKAIMSTLASKVT